MPRFIVGMLFLVFSVAAAVPAVVSDARAANTSFEDAMAVRALGDPKAPVTIYEFASMSCSHCAAFHRDVLPDLKKEYIETGKVRFVFTDFPLGGLALAGSMVNRCVSGTDKKFFTFLDVLFKQQKRWAFSDTPRDDLEKLARLAGMSSEDFEACLDDEKLQKAILARAQEAQNKYKIKATPSFVIGERVIQGNMALEDFREVIDKALADAQ